MGSIGVPEAKFPGRGALSAPRVHHGAAPLEGSFAPVGSLGGALDGVSEGKFGQLTGTFVLSATQSRNVLRMPWTEMAGLMRWQARRNAFSESIWSPPSITGCGKQ